MEQLEQEFEYFMQDTYDEIELHYMDSGFVEALRQAFINGWRAKAAHHE